MRAGIIFFICCFLQVNLRAQDSMFTNPVLHADYSDPDAIRVGDDYYMVSSSFNNVPGLPILHSKDLVNWKLIGHALKKLVPEEHYSKVRHGGGVWAPSIRHFNNEFYIYYPDPDFGIYLVKSKNIRGPWTKPVLVIEGKGLIDPCPLFESDGKIYLVNAYAGSRAGFKSIIAVRELNKEGTAAITDPVMVYDGHENDPTVEGPKFYKRGNYYYIFAPAGGVSSGWQLALRSENIYGPYERKIVMHQGSSLINGPHQGALIGTKTGEEWFLHFQDKEAYGRVVHLQPVTWKNGWPIIGNDADGDGTGEPVQHYKYPLNKNRTINPDQCTDEFSNPVLSPQWQWQANPGEGWGFTSGSGTYRMFSSHIPDTVQSLWDHPALLGQKLPSEKFTATVKFLFKPYHEGESFGLVVFGTDYASISLKKQGTSLNIICSENTGADRQGREKIIATVPVQGNEFYFRLQMREKGMYDFLYSVDGKDFNPIGKTFLAKPGKWVGARLAFYCTRSNITNNAGFADIDYIRFD